MTCHQKLEYPSRIKTLPPLQANYRNIRHQISTILTGQAALVEEPGPKVKRRLSFAKRYLTSHDLLAYYFAAGKGRRGVFSYFLNYLAIVRQTRLNLAWDLDIDV
ncbi:MAG: hypothetical protein N4A65_02725 [Cohaesibacter sp.]|jgi:hypothetical protein|nr:hypothetical protein [Cohaesibacter sp.]